MSREIITIYEPNSRQKLCFFGSWIYMVINIVRSRELIWQLFKRDFLMSYKKSFLGMTWIFIQPIIGIVSWVFMNATGILNPGDVGIPYPAYVLLSSSIFGLFMGFYSAAEGTLGAGSGFIMQVRYPHEALLIKQTAQHLANFLITFIVNLVVLFAFEVCPSWKIIFFPFLTLPLFFLGAGMGLIISVFSVVAVEVQKAVNTLLQFVIYITPIIYSSKVDNPTLQAVIKWNPLTYLIGSVRDLIIYGKMNNVQEYLISSLIAFIIFLFSWRLFYLSEERVIERMI